MLIPDSASSSATEGSVSIERLTIPKSGPGDENCHPRYRTSQAQAPQGLDDGFDLLFALFVGAAESGGEGGGVGPGFGEEGADQGDLGGEFVGPGEGGRDGPDGSTDLR